MRFPVTLKNVDKAPFPWFGGNTNQGDETHQQHRERLWLSPHCLTPEPDPQMTLWADE